MGSSKDKGDCSAARALTQHTASTDRMSVHVDVSSQGRSAMQLGTDQARAATLRGAEDSFATGSAGVVHSLLGLERECF